MIAAINLYLASNARGVGAGLGPDSTPAVVAADAAPVALGHLGVPRAVAPRPRLRAEGPYGPEEGLAGRGAVPAGAGPSAAVGASEVGHAVLGAAGGVGEGSVAVAFRPVLGTKTFTLAADGVTVSWAVLVGADPLAIVAGEVRHVVHVTAGSVREGPVAVATGKVLGTEAQALSSPVAAVGAAVGAGPLAVATGEGAEGPDGAAGGVGEGALAVAVVAVLGAEALSLSAKGLAGTLLYAPPGPHVALEPAASCGRRYHWKQAALKKKRSVSFTRAALGIKEASLARAVGAVPGAAAVSSLLGARGPAPVQGPILLGKGDSSQDEAPQNRQKKVRFLTHDAFCGKQGLESTGVDIH